MTNQDYLIKRGWKQEGVNRRVWIDPLDNSRWSMSAAVSFQQARDARRLDTALAALELAEPLLEAFATLNRNFASRAAGQRYTDSVTAALAKVRAAREGREP